MGDAYQGHGHGQDWWSRLSNTQAEMLRPLSAQLFEKLDDALFDRSGSSFQQFFEGMRVLRKNREALIQGWFDRLDEAWKSLRPQAPGSFRPRLVSAAGAPVDANGGFSLVDDVTLERKLAIESSIARGASLCRMELPPLCHRLTVLRKGAVVEADEVPAAPALLVQTFAKSLDEVPSLPVEVALVVFKLFDRVVVSTVEAGCKELNRILVQGGVVPQWNWSPAAAHRAAMARSNRAMPAAPAPQRESWEDPSWLETVPALGPDLHDASMLPGADFADGNFVVPNIEFGAEGFPSPVEQARLTATVRALLEHRRMARYATAWAPGAGHAQAMPGAAGPAMPMGPMAGWNPAMAEPVPRALELHTLMEVLASLPPPKLPTSWVGEAEETWDPGMLKHELSRSLLQRMPPTKAAPAAGASESAKDGRADQAEVPLGEHEDVIDMVAMMFSYIQQDQALPAGVQALLARLQLPYLRLALVDSRMFTDADHPARALMDRLAEVGKSCTPGSPMLAEKMLKMHALVGRIVANHDVGYAFFEREWTQFRTWSDAVAERAAARERDQLTALANADPKALADEAPAAVTSADEAIIDTKSEPPLAEEAAATKPAPAANASAEQLAERSRLHQIRLAVTARMHGRLDGRDMPEGLRHILSLLWVNRQTRICQQYGERSYEASWLERQLDSVVALLSVKPSAKAQNDLDQDWPGMERAWGDVLAEGPASAEARARWIAMFRRWAEIRTGKTAADPAQQWNWHEGFTASADPVHPSAVEDVQSLDEVVEESAPAEPSSPVEADAAPATGRSSAFKIKPILTKPSPTRWAIGDWIEFKDEASEGAAEPKASRAGRGKVSWIGAFTGRTILVKPDGTIWREESRVDLDDLLDREQAFIVPRASLFDRSLQSMFRKLRDGVTSALS